MSSYNKFAREARKPCDMEVEEFKAFTNKYLELPASERGPIFAEAFGIEACRSEGGVMSMTPCSAKDKSHKLSGLIHQYRKDRILSPMDILLFVGNKTVTSVSRKANHTDAFSRVSDMGYSQEMAPLNAKTTEIVERFVADKCPDDKAIFQKFVAGEKDKPIMIVKNSEEEVIGVGAIKYGNISYSISEKTLSPIKFEKSNVAHAALASVLSRHVEVTKDLGTKIITYNDDYVLAMNLNSLFREYNEMGKRIGACGIELSDAMRNVIKPVKGKGASNESYWFELLIRATDADNTDITEEILSNMCSVYNQYVKKGSIHCKIANKAITIHFSPCDTELKPKWGGRPVFVSKESDISTAMEVCKTRRNAEGEGDSGISGLSLAYAYGVKLPKSVLDVTTHATDLRMLVKAAMKEGKSIGLVSVGNTIDYEPYLKALRFCGFDGDVYVSDADVGRLLEKNNPRPSDRSLYNQFSTQGKYGYSKFTLKKGPVLPEHYVIAVVKDYGIRHNDDINTKSTKYNQKVRARDEFLRNYPNYIVNVYCPLEEGNGIFSSFEAHNLMGWKITVESCIAVLNSYDYKKLPNDFVQPFYGKHIPVACARANLANITRGQYPYTLRNFKEVCSMYGVPFVYPVRGNLSGIHPANVLIDGIQLSVAVANREMREALLSGGSEEVKQLVRQQIAVSGLSVSSEAGSNDTIVKKEKEEESVSVERVASDSRELEEGDY